EDRSHITLEMQDLAVVFIRPAVGLHRPGRAFAGHGVVAFGPALVDINPRPAGAEGVSARGAQVDLRFQLQHFAVGVIDAVARTDARIAGRTAVAGAVIQAGEVQLGNV